MQLTPDLFDAACRRAADKVHELDSDKLAALLGPTRLRPEEVELLLQVFPPEGGPHPPDGPKEG